MGKHGVTDTLCCHTGQHRGLGCFSCPSNGGKRTPSTGNASRRPSLRGKLARWKIRRYSGVLSYESGSAQFVPAIRVIRRTLALHLVFNRSLAERWASREPLRFLRLDHILTDSESHQPVSWNSMIYRCYKTLYAFALVMHS